jgi:hypothetical protein
MIASLFDQRAAAPASVEAAALAGEASSAPDKPSTAAVRRMWNRVAMTRGFAEQFQCPIEEHG